MTHVRTAPYYPQSNGKLERYHKTIKSDAIRPGAPKNLDEARVVVTKFVAHYNTVRLHSAIGYLAPADFFAGRGKQIGLERDRKLEPVTTDLALAWDGFTSIPDLPTADGTPPMVVARLWN